MKKWLPSIIIMLVIFILSSVKGQVINDLGLGKEQLQISAHSILFFILCFTYFKSTKNILLSIILTMIYGVFDEFHQRFTPYRSSSLFDIYVDSLGALFAGVILWRLQYLLPKKLKNWLKN